MSEDVKIERSGPIMLCTINRPERNNSITPSVFKGLLTAFREADLDPECKVIVTKAEGKNFCVGADSADLGNWVGQPLDQVYYTNFAGKQGTTKQYSPKDSLDPLGMNRWAFEVVQIDTPMIAAIRGAAAGGGLALALLHHFRVADTSAHFSTGFGRLGLAGELGLSYILPDLIGRQAALQMLIADRSMSGQEAKEAGLVDEIVEPDQLDEEVMKLADRIASLSPASVRASLRAVLEPRRETLRSVMELEYNQQRTLWSSSEFQDGVRRLLAKLNGGKTEEKS